MVRTLLSWGCWPVGGGVVCSGAEAAGASAAATVPAVEDASRNRKKGGKLRIRRRTDKQKGGGVPRGISRNPNARYESGDEVEFSGQRIYLGKNRICRKLLPLGSRDKQSHRNHVLVRAMALGRGGRTGDRRHDVPPAD